MQNPRQIAALMAVLTALIGMIQGCGYGGSETAQIATAKEYLAKNDLKAAFVTLKSVLQKNDRSAEARYLLGKALIESGDLAGGMIELHKSLEFDGSEAQIIPELARAMVLLGQDAPLISQFGAVRLSDASAAADLKTSLATAFARTSDKDKAEKAAAEALSLRPGYAPALIVQARLNIGERNFDAALKLLDQVLTADAGNNEAGNLKGEIQLLTRDKPETALASFQQALDANPKSVSTRAVVASLLFNQGKVAEAKLEFEKLKKESPNHPDTLTLEARLAFGDKNYKLVRSIMERIIKARPNDPAALQLAGAAELRMQSHLMAESLLSRSLKVSPKQPITRLLLAQSLLQSGQPEKTLEVLRPMLESNKVDGATLALAGQAYLQMGDAKRSSDAFQKATKVAPKDASIRTAAAVALLEEGNNSRAMAELESVSRSDSGPSADLAIVSARIRDGDLPGAQKALDALEKKVPTRALPHLLRGRVHLMQNDLAAATKSFEAALAREPGFFPAVASLAATDLAQGKTDAARGRFENYLKDNPKNYQAKLALAELASRTGAPAARSIELLREAVKLGAGEPGPHLALVTALITSGDGKGALLASQEAAAALPDNLEILAAQGRAEMAAGDSQRAISTFKKLTALQPRNPLHEMWLADAYMMVQDRKAADRSLRRAVELQPDSIPANQRLARLALQDKRPQDALAVARAVQKRSPSAGAGYALEGDVEVHLKNWTAAVAAYRAALKREKSTELVIKQHAALVAGSQGAEAERLAAEWVKERPKEPAFLYYLGDAALTLRDYALAESRYRSVLELQPDNALAMNNVAWLLVQQGKPGSVPIAERANALRPNRPEFLDTLSIALEANNQLPQAVDAQKRARSLRPKDGALTLRLAKLYIKQGDKTQARVELDALAQLGDKFAGQAEVTALLKTL